MRSRITPEFQTACIVMGVSKLRVWAYENPRAAPMWIWILLSLFWWKRVNIIGKQRKICSQATVPLILCCAQDWLMSPARIVRFLDFSATNITKNVNFPSVFICFQFFSSFHDSIPELGEWFSNTKFRSLALFTFMLLKFSIIFNCIEKIPSTKSWGNSPGVRCAIANTEALMRTASGVGNLQKELGTAWKYV